MKCISCGRRGHLESQYCLYCGGDLIKQEREGPINCPSCHEVMVEVERNGVLFDVCSSCNGIWLDAGELDTLIHQSPTPELETIGLDTQANLRGPARFQPIQNGYRKCPICEKFMGQKNYRRYSGVIIDSCQAHGVFLDSLELEKLQVFLASGGLERERSFQERDQRNAFKAEIRAEKRQRLQQSRSSSMVRKINPETEFTIDIIDGIGDFLKWLCTP